MRLGIRKARILKKFCLFCSKCLRRNHQDGIYSISFVAAGVITVFLGGEVVIVSNVRIGSNAGNEGNNPVYINDVRIKVMLGLTASQPICLGVKHSSGAHD
jgi:hypothetical protein